MNGYTWLRTLLIPDQSKGNYCIQGRCGVGIKPLHSPTSCPGKSVANQKKKGKRNKSNTPHSRWRTQLSPIILIPSVHKVLSPRLSCFLYEKPLGSMRAPLKNRCSESMKESLDWNSASFIKEIHFSRPSQFVEGCFHHPWQRKRQWRWHCLYNDDDDNDDDKEMTMAVNISMTMMTMAWRRRW